MKPGRKAIAAIYKVPDTRLVNAMAALAFLAALAPQMPLLAQGLDNGKAIDTIIGSEVETERDSAVSDRDRLIAAIEAAPDTITRINKSFNLDKVELVFLPDFADSDGTLKGKIAEHRTQITGLRSAIEGNAMLFHAIDSRAVALSDIIAVSFEDENNVRIYAVGEPPKP